MNAALVFFLRLLFIILTYLFVGWIAYTIYKDLQAQFQNQKDALASRITLRALVNQEPIEKQFAAPEIIIGRDPDCDFAIPDETISLRHCKLAYHHKQWWATDLNSTNGTFINENPVDSPTVITESDELRVGKVLIIIQINQ